jgi:hypothetical protein
MSVGILAFGSIADKPGTELAAATTRRIEVETPFAVEFARSSRTRDGAPTLVPVSEGGTHASAVVLVLKGSVTAAQAHAMLYERETRRRFDINNQSRVAWIAELPNTADVLVHERAAEIVDAGPQELLGSAYPSLTHEAWTWSIWPR